MARWLNIQGTPCHPQGVGAMREHSLVTLVKNPVFSVSAAVIGVLSLLGILLPGPFAATADRLYRLVSINFDWLYLLAVFGFVVFLVGLALSPWGRVRLGQPDDRPEFGFFAWIGMLFSAGFGIGLVFWGVAEPLSHFVLPPLGGAEPQTEAAGRLAMGYAFFHWGVSQWAIFGLVGLVIAYFEFHRREDGRISTALHPLTGHGPRLRDSVDILAIIATVLGMATSLGMGVLQTNGGLHTLFGVPNTPYVHLLIVVTLAVVYLGFTLTRLGTGIQYLSILNLSLVLGLLLAVFLLGPTLYIVKTFFLGLWDYAHHFLTYSLRLGPGEGDGWTRQWTLFYWAWIIAWSPFVGAFVARVSRGRTIREYVAAVLTVPPMIACFWFAVFGGTALYRDLEQNAGLAGSVSDDVSASLFQLLETLPLGTLLSWVALLLVVTFLITSAAAASYILGSMSSGGRLSPPTPVRVVWTFLVSAIAAALLFAGGLGALQTASLVAAVPFSIIMVLMGVALIQALRSDSTPPN
ncbi:BCCT family transporter [Ectothiorhodospira variabilis]|uniref:BCCT family transporter n=1 Tax=Ectothiorhodospira variabilis TaxID=505694 RepID=UPI001EFA97C1|nr:BCCT family transporter [Ectothiorhodospira variabilis]MCG5498405.1 BCCT family transporter [Ectothiorhodospira variabilis]